MNILILSWRGPGHPNAGGAEIVTHEHAKAWVKNGHKVTLFTSSFPYCKEYENIDGINIIRCGDQSFGVKWEAFKWYITGDHDKFDVVFDHFHGLPFFTPFYVKAKKVAFIHEVAKEVWKLNPWPKPFNLVPWILGTLLEPFIFILFYRKIQFICISESTRSDLLSWGIPQKNIEIIYDGVIIHSQKNKFSKETQPTVAFLGALSKDKGAEDVIKVFSFMIRNGFNGKLWIIGKGTDDYIHILKNNARNLGIEDRIRIWGYVSEEKKFELLKRAHIVINPSVREGWGLVVIEAAAMGTPTVGYRVQGLRDSIIHNETGILVDTNPKSMADAVISLFQDNALYKRLSQNAVKRSKELTWDKAVEHSLRYLDDLKAKS